MTNEKKFAAKSEVKGAKFTDKLPSAGVNTDNLFAFLLAIGTGLLS